MNEPLSERVGTAVFWILTTLFILAAIILRPIWFIFDRRRYVIPNETYGKPLGWYKFYCLAHYGLKEDAICPNCGLKKVDLIRQERTKAEGKN